MKTLRIFKQLSAVLVAIALTVALPLGADISTAQAQSCGCPGNCSQGCCNKCCCPRDCCPWQHCCGVWGEFLYLHPTGADMAHGQQQVGTGGPGTVPFGRIGVADPDYQPGVSLGMNWALTNCSSFAVAYTFYESNTLDVLELGAAPAIGSLVQHPNAAVISSTGPLTATYDIDFQIADFVYRRLIFGDNRSWMNYSIGARYGHLDQDFYQTGVFSGSQFGVIDVLTDVKFDGGGLVLGLEGERMVGYRGFSVYGNLGVSPLAGQFTTSYTMTNVSTATQLANAQLKDDRFVTILDYEVGLAWTSCCRCWRLSTGYTASFWYNTITTPVFIDAVQADNYVDIGDTLSFDGLTARVEYRF